MEKIFKKIIKSKGKENPFLFVKMSIDPFYFYFTHKRIITFILRIIGITFLM